MLRRNFIDSVSLTETNKHTINNFPLIDEYLTDLMNRRVVETFPLPQKPFMLPGNIIYV